MKIQTNPIALSLYTELFDDLKIIETFIFYDEPVLYVGCNKAGQGFLFVLIEEKTDGERIYLVSEITPERWVAIRHSVIDVRQAFTDPERRLFLVGNNHASYIATENLTENMLPDKGARVNVQLKETSK